MRGREREEWGQGEGERACKGYWRVVEHGGSQRRVEGGKERERSSLGTSKGPTRLPCHC